MIQLIIRVQRTESGSSSGANMREADDNGGVRYQRLLTLHLWPLATNKTSADSPLRRPGCKGCVYNTVAIQPTDEGE